MLHASEHHAAAHLASGDGGEFHRLYDVVAEIVVEGVLNAAQLSLALLTEGAAQVFADDFTALADCVADDEIEQV